MGPFVILLVCATNKEFNCLFRDVCKGDTFSCPSGEDCTITCDYIDTCYGSTSLHRTLKWHAKYHRRNKIKQSNITARDVCCVRATTIQSLSKTLKWHAIHHTKRSNLCYSA
eukprot:381490_1